MSHQDKVISLQEKNEVMTVEKAESALAEVNSILNSKFVKVPDYAKSNPEKNFISPIAIKNEDTLVPIVGLPMAFGLAHVIVLPALSSMFSSFAIMMGSIAGFGLIGLSLSFFAVVFTRNYNGGGDSVGNQPIRKILSRWLLTKKQRKLLAHRAEERETYFTALKIKELFANKMLEELKQNGCIDMLVQQKDKDNEHLNIGHTVEFDSKTQNLEFLSYEKPDIEVSRTDNRQLIIDMMKEMQGTPSIS